MEKPFLKDKVELDILETEQASYDKSFLKRQGDKLKLTENLLNKSDKQTCLNSSDSCLYQ